MRCTFFLCFLDNFTVFGHPHLLGFMRFEQDISFAIHFICSNFVASKQNNEREDKRYIATVFVPHRCHSLGFVYTLLYYIFCSDGIANICCYQKCIVVYLLWIGKDFSIQWTHNTWSRRMEKTKSVFQYK